LPTDRIAREYLRAKKYLGSSDRRIISELLYTILRIKSFPDYVQNTTKINDAYQSIFSDKKISDVIFVLSSLLAIRAMNIQITSYSDEFRAISSNKTSFIEYLAEKISQKFNVDEHKLSNLLNESNVLIDDLIEKTNNLVNPDIQKKEMLDFYAVRLGLQPWIVHSLITSGRYTGASLSLLSESLFKQAPITLRINSEQSQREGIIEKLREFDQKCQITKFSPFGLTLSKRIDLNTVPIYKNGLVDVQDEGSQLISIALGPKQGESILDACSGAGGKTMHICSMMNNQGKIIATDVEFSKLKELHKRAKRSGFDIITTTSVKNHQSGIYDRVLIDAPCSGMGTVRRNPMLKWTLSPKILAKYTENQYRILELNSSFVKNGGTLVYATCSFIPDENEMVVNRFLANNPDFSPEPLKPSFDDYGISLPGLSDDAYQYQLLPSVHGCDGFYFAKMNRTI